MTNVKTKFEACAFFGPTPRQSWMPEGSTLFSTREFALEYILIKLQSGWEAKSEIRVKKKEKGSYDDRRYGSVAVTWAEVTPLERTPHSVHNIVFRSRGGNPKHVLRRAIVIPAVDSDSYQLVK